MDEQDEMPDHTLSFVDVITNGLGSLLVLFFIMVLVQDVLHWSDEPEAPPSMTAPTDNPMMIVVRAKPGVAPVDAAGQSPWRFTPSAAGLGLSDSRGRDWDWGTDYAILISPEPIPNSARVALNTSWNPTDVIVEVYVGGGKNLVDAERVDGLLKVWPLPLRPIAQPAAPKGEQP